jgi:probable addiction module antidote protein
MFADDLRDPAYAAGYLNITLEDDGIEGFLYALQKVARAHGVSQVASGSDLPRESLYRALSEKGNPGIKPLARVLDALGLRLTITPTIREAADMSVVTESPMTADQPAIIPERLTPAAVASGAKVPLHTS